jgi:hypothetical protein
VVFRMLAIRTSVALGLSFAASCAKVPSGALGTPAEIARTEIPRLESRAAFDLDCPIAEITLSTLNASTSAAGNVPSEVGAQGCGRRTVYVRSGAVDENSPYDETWLRSGGATRGRDDPPKAPASSSASAPPASAPRRP